MVSSGFEPANLGTKGQHATPRPPKPLVIIMWRENFEKMSANSSAFSLSLFAHGPWGFEYLLIGDDVVLGFLLFFISYQIELSSLLRLEKYFSKDSFRNSWRLDLSLLLFRLYILLLPGVWVLWQIDLALLFSATKKVKQSRYRPGVVQRVPGS